MIKIFFISIIAFVFFTGCHAYVVSPEIRIHDVHHYNHSFYSNHNHKYHKHSNNSKHKKNNWKNKH